MGKLRTFLVSAAIGVSPLGGSVAGSGKIKIDEPAKKTAVAKDTFSRFREAEKHAFPLLVFFEGCSFEAYKDCNGIPTIGIGNITFPDGRKVTIKDKLKNSGEMYAMVSSYLEKRAYPLLNKYITRRLEPEEMAALISLSYNCGAEIFEDGGRPSRFARLINDGAPVEDLARAFLRKSYSRKGFNKGLAVRRCMEVLYAEKALTFEDFQNFYICSYDKLNYKDLSACLKAGDREGMRKAAAHVRRVCSAVPDPETAKKREWFGGNRKVSFFTPKQADKYPEWKFSPALLADSQKSR